MEPNDALCHGLERHWIRHDHVLDRRGGDVWNAGNVQLGQMLRERKRHVLVELEPLDLVFEAPVLALHVAHAQSQDPRFHVAHGRLH